MKYLTINVFQCCVECFRYQNFTYFLYRMFKIANCLPGTRTGINDFRYFSMAYSTPLQVTRVVRAFYALKRETLNTRTLLSNNGNLSVH